MIVNFLLLPLTMLLMCLLFSFMITGAGVVKFNEKCGLSSNKFKRSNCCMRSVILLLWVLEFLIISPLPIALSVIMTAIVIVPAYIV